VGLEGPYQFDFDDQPAIVTRAADEVARFVTA